MEHAANPELHRLSPAAFDAPAFLLDLDGTPVDNVYQRVLAWHEALLRARIKPFRLAHPPSNRSEGWITSECSKRCRVVDNGERPASRGGQERVAAVRLLLSLLA